MKKPLVSNRMGWILVWSQCIWPALQIVSPLCKVSKQNHICHHACSFVCRTLHTSHCTWRTAVHCKLHTANCTLHRENCTLHTALCKPHTTHCILHISYCTLHTVHCKLHTANSTLHTAHWTLHTLRCTLHTAHFTLHTAHCTLHTAHCTLLPEIQNAWSIPYNLNVALLIKTT